MPKITTPQELLPLTPRVFLILWSLSQHENHGYGLLREVEELGRGRVSIKPGSLYESIDSLSRRGLIEQVDGSGGDSRRRTYQITAFGTEVVEAEAARLGDLVDDLRAAKLIKQA